MNNWRLLLLAVVAVLQPIGSFTEQHLIDGRQECCDHRSNSFTQETRFHGNSPKTILEDRRLDIQRDYRKDQQRFDARYDPIRSRERLSVETTKRRVSSESVDRLSTETRFVKEQERRQRSVDSRVSRQTREDQSRRVRENVSRNSLSRYERDNLGFRRNRMSRDDTSHGRVGNERVYGKSIESQDTQKVGDYEDFRRVSVNREVIADNRGRDHVARDERHRDSRIGIFRTENRLQYDNRERRNLNRREREDTKENRRSRSLETRINSVERDNHRSSFRTISERLVEQRDQNKDARDRTVVNLRDSSERISANHRRDSRSSVERELNRRNIRDYRTNERIEIQRQDENRQSQVKAAENHESRLNADQRRSFSRESRNVNANVRSERIVRSNGRTDVQREVSTDQQRQERRESSTRSFDRLMSYEREFTARIPVRNVRDERFVRDRRDVRSEERLDERKEQRYGMLENKQTNIRDSRDSAQLRQEPRSSTVRFEANARFVQESRQRDRDNIRSDVRREREERAAASRKQTLERVARDTERRHDDQLSRASRFAERTSSEDRVSRVREEQLDWNREAHDRTVVVQRPTRCDSVNQRRSDTTIIESNTHLQRARTLGDIREGRQAVSERDESRASSDRISMSRISRGRIERREARETLRGSRVDTRNDVIRNRGVGMIHKIESRHQNDESRIQDIVLQRQARDILTVRSLERKSREMGSRNVEIRAERLSSSRNDRNINEQDVRNDARASRVVESRRESRRMTEVQPNRYNLVMEQMNRAANRDVRIESKLRSIDIVLTKGIRAETWPGEARDTRFRSFEANLREADPIDNSDNPLSWQIVFYTLQGAYLCGLMMQMFTEKSNKGKSRNIIAWWSSSSQDLVKVD